MVVGERIQPQIELKSLDLEIYRHISMYDMISSSSSSSSLTPNLSSKLVTSILTFQQELEGLFCPIDPDATQCRLIDPETLTTNCGLVGESP